MSKPSNEMQTRGEAIGLPWDGKQGASAYGNKVRKAEARAAEGVKSAPQSKTTANPGDDAAIRALWRQGRRKEALSYGK
jgi:hypothetical protein